MDPQDPTNPVSTPIYPAPGTPATPVVAVPGASGDAYVPPAPETYAAPDIPMDALPEEGSRVPQWISIGMGITIVVFFGVTGLLVMAMMQKPAAAPSAVPTVAVKAPTTVVSSAPEPTVANATTSATDEVEVLDAEAQQVDFSDIDETLIP